MLDAIRQCLGRSRFQCPSILIICIIVINGVAAKSNVEISDLQVLPDRSSSRQQQQQQQQEQQQQQQQQQPPPRPSPSPPPSSSPPPEPDSALLQNYAHDCTPPTLQQWPVGPPRVPALPAGQKPNFIVVLVDDQGFDDIGLHHPRGPDGIKSAGAQTPNLDKLIKNGMSFQNFYASSLCAISRAALLTGRDAVRTGNLFNGMGYDAFSLKEATMGDVMQQAGYITSHYGKWHNGKAQGYEPWNRGFNESWLPDDYVHVDNLMRHNGAYAPTKGLMELALLNRMTKWWGEREADGKPFLTYYAPFAIHRKPAMDGPPVGIDEAYFSPQSYLRRIRNQKPTPDPWTARLWAMLMYFDEVLGRIADFVDNSPTLRTNTYIIIAGDNGPALPTFVEKADINRLRRMPSGMLGDKNTFIKDSNIRSSGTEGSLRNHLTVWGPGVTSGGVSNTLLSLTDVLPTIADLAGATGTRHRPWSGSSFANLLAPGAQPTKKQENRFMFSFVASGASGQCPQVDRLMTELLPDLNSDREVMRPQPLLAYRDPSGNPVMKNCIIGRHKDYKWYGSTDQLFRLSNGSHIELPCNEVKGEEFLRVSTMFSQVGRQWWNDVVAEPTSFTKPTYNIGQAGTLASNVEAAGAIAIARGDINMTANVNFRGMGYACFSVNVVKRGMYAVTAMYRARFDGPKPDIVISVGEWRDIVAGKTPSLTQTIGARSDVAGSRVGTMFLEPSDGKRTEVCLKLLGVPRSPGPATTPSAQQQQNSSDTSSLTSNAAAGLHFTNRVEAWSLHSSTYVAVQGSWLFRLLNLRFVLLPWVKRTPSWGCCQVNQAGVDDGMSAEELSPTASTGAAAARAAVAAGSDPAGHTTQQLEEEAQQLSSGDGDSVPYGIPDAVLQAALTETSATPEDYTYFKATPEMVELERDVRVAARHVDNQAAAAAALRSTNSYGSRDSDSWRVASFASYPGGSSTHLRKSAGSGAPKPSSSRNGTSSRKHFSRQQAWKRLKAKYNYEPGQGVFDSLYRPCLAETKGTCSESC